MIASKPALVLGSIAALALGACGGSGGDGAGNTPAMPPSFASYGTVTAFGSVVVNGVRFDTSTASFMLDGNPGAQSDLAVGDVILARGTIDASGTAAIATSVVFDDLVQGPIGTIDLAASTFTVLGQTVRVSADTSFDDRIQPASLAGLAVGAVVEVSGLRELAAIRATRIEPQSAGAELELTGVLTGHQELLHLFFVDAQLIDYSLLVGIRSPRGSGLANLQMVEVRGGAVANGIWRPDTIDVLANGLAGAAGERREVEGFIARFVSAADFSVLGLAVTTNAQTVFSGGTATDLGLDVKIEVEGTLDAAGVLVASKLDIRRASAVRFAARVDSVNAASPSFVVLGVTVRADARTRIEDKSTQPVRPFGVANLVAGDYVEVRGGEHPTGSGELLATLVERDEAKPDSELQGFVQAVAPPNFTILGVTIGTNAATVFRDVADVPLTAAQFFAQLAAGDLVKARGLVVGTRALQANEVAFED